jgi:two-component system cell cycle response regulator DivK
LISSFACDQEKGIGMKKVLVIEDNKDNLRLITYALNRSGYEVVSAETGEEGVQLALSERPFFIVMDMNLPVIDGYTATRHIRNAEAGNPVPIIAITSYAMVGDREKAIAAGCNGYIEKPIDPLTVVEKIHEALKLMGKLG